MLLGVCVLLIAGLNQDPKKIASALIDKPVPEFYQANLHESSQIVSPKDFPKQPFLLNVWGSWCGYCKEEHPLLIEIAKNLPIVAWIIATILKMALKCLREWAIRSS